MRSWSLPAEAAAFWAGLLTRPVAAQGRAPVWPFVAVTLFAFAAAIAASPRRAVGRSPLVAAGLITPDPPSVEVVTSVRTRAERSPAVGVSCALVGVFALGITWGAVHDARLGGSLLARLAPERIAAAGTLRTDPSSSPLGWFAVVDLSRVKAGTSVWSVRESAWVSGDDAPPTAVRGDRLSLSGVVLVPDDPGFADALRRKGIVAELRASEVERLGGSANAFVRATQVFRAFVGRSITRLFPPREAGLLLGLALGDDSRLDPSLARDFQATGLGHLLVVSGENVAMVLGPMLGLALALHLRRWPRFLVGLGTVVFFVVLTGAEPSVMRAGVMAGLTLLGVLLGRPRSAGSILAGAVLFLLVLDPWLVWSIGFQLSVAATAGMVALASPLADRMRFLPRSVALAAGTTLAAQFGVTPILLFHFHEVPGVTVLANLAAFPAVSPALLLGLLAAGLGLAWLPLGRVVAGAAMVPMRYLELVADRLGKAPVGWITGGGPMVLVAGIGLAVILASWLRTGRRPPRRAFAAAAFVLPLLVWSTAISAGPPSQLTIQFFDVGQGDGALIQTPEGANVLIDGGPEPDEVATDLAALGVKRLDVVVATHAHADHVIGLPAVLARFPAGLVLEPGCPVEGAPYQADLDRAIADEHVPVEYPRAGDVYSVGALRLDVLSPDRCWEGTNSDPNNDSIVLLVTYREDTVLMAGEPEVEAQQVMLEEGEPLRADVFKVPHHGAATSVPEFFEAVDAELSVIPVGQPNPYGHPAPETLRALQAAGTAIWRTDQHGDITVTFAPQGPTVESER
ncbi:MAG TPA: DNA internalization-related competence protein ComEC/Rec2 [Actinomycetota bacterium]|nr:DNA internalization-related competence protein ComEC/Rec2 [Actinomycetota bacterium]